MVVEEIMTRDVVSVRPDTKLTRMSELMRERKVRHLPVVDEEGRLVGILSHRDIQRATPSAITTLDVGEVNYLLSRITAERIMHRDVVTCRPDTLVEQAGCLMRERKVGCLPVVDDEGRLVGILTGIDLVDFFMDITGCRAEGTVRIEAHLPDRPGQLAEFLGVLAREGAYVATVVAPLNPVAEGQRAVIVRIRAEDPERVLGALRAASYEIVRVHHPEPGCVAG
ncbi:CBS and ACT domain-containing protein [Inmirania thermothiophila]|uniref:Acetoin utilization protein AcuB n=1 Tax=Inmirania thermothiophila TaxID=1750597 RepID=A0A3N1Y1V1_9GAMM|nr:CBS and ACT domain-containing protein [Inmirania thermothiophila]ROR32488.1 acetoin utilization protein AcuB [Inmirania thermothiophila]